MPTQLVEHQTVIEEIKAAIEASTKKSKRLLVKTLFKAFDFNNRTRDRIEYLSQLLSESGITTTPDLREVEKQDWITLTLLNPAVPVITNSPNTVLSLTINDPWFDNILGQKYNSEREVEFRFILPLLQRLGYEDEDRADGYPVNIHQGIKKTTKEADFVLFDGAHRSEDHTLLVVEAKAEGKKLQEYIGQAKSYAMWLSAPYYLVTNSNEIRVFLYRSPIQSDVELFSCTRNGLKQEFAKLYKLIGKPAVVEYRRQRSLTAH